MDIKEFQARGPEGNKLFKFKKKKKDDEAQDIPIPKDDRLLSEKIAAGDAEGFGNPDVDASGRNAEQRKEAGQEFISAREKALSRGASKDEANRIANEASSVVGNEVFDPGASARVDEDLRAILNPNLNLPRTIGQQNFPNPSNLLAGAGGGALAELGTGARVGIGALALGTAPFSVPIAAGVMTVGFLAALYLSLRSEAKTTIRVEGKTLGNNRKNLNAHIAAVNVGINPEQAIDDFRTQLQMIDQSYSNLKYTATIKNKIVGADNRDALKNFDDFYAQGGERERLVLQMFAARNAPNPQAGAMMLQQLAANMEPQEPIL